VLILITSAGIYGFLSGAYQETANKEGIVTQQITALETKKALYEETRDNFLADRKSNNELRGTLSKGSTTQFTDKNGNLVVRTNNSAIRNIESTAKENERLATKLDVVNDSIFSLETQILETKVNSEAASELGPLKYLSELTGIKMNRIINWLLLIIIFVFDPLAIALVIAANFAFTKLRTHNALNELTKIQEEEGLYDNEGTDIYTEKELEELKDWDVTLNDGLEDETKDWKIVDEENIFDLNGDGKVEKEEIDQILNQMSDIGESLPTIDQWRKDQFNSKINKLKQIVNKSKSDDDLTINY
jgi:hypothetical protein